MMENCVSVAGDGKGGASVPAGGWAGETEPAGVWDGAGTADEEDAGVDIDGEGGKGVEDEDRRGTALEEVTGVAAAGAGVIFGETTGEDILSLLGVKLSLLGDELSLGDEEDGLSIGDAEVLSSFSFLGGIVRTDKRINLKGTMCEK